MVIRCFLQNLSCHFLTDKSLVLLVIQILETYFYKLSFFVWKKVKNLAQCSVVICQMPSKIERDIVIDWCRREKGNQEFSYSISPFSPLLFYKVCYIGMSGFISTVVDVYKNLNELCRYCVIGKVAHRSRVL